MPAIEWKLPNRTGQEVLIRTSDSEFFNLWKITLNQADSTEVLRFWRVLGWWSLYNKRNSAFNQWVGQPYLNSNQRQHLRVLCLAKLLVYFHLHLQNSLITVHNRPKTVHSRCQEIPNPRTNQNRSQTGLLDSRRGRLEGRCRCPGHVRGQGLWGKNYQRQVHTWALCILRGWARLREGGLLV